MTQSATHESTLHASAHGPYGTAPNPLVALLQRERELRQVIDGAILNAHYRDPGASMFR